MVASPTASVPGNVHRDAAPESETVHASQPDALRPLDAPKCGKVYCVSVVGIGLTVEYEVVTSATGGAVSGDVNAENDPAGSFEWTAAGKASAKSNLREQQQLSLP